MNDQDRELWELEQHIEALQAALALEKERTAQALAPKPVVRPIRRVTAENSTLYHWHDIDMTMAMSAAVKDLRKAAWYCEREAQPLEKVSGNGM